VERLAKPPEERPNLIPFGITALDKALGGMAAGDMTILAGRTGMGKTAVGICVADHVASTGAGVFMASLEMKRDQLAERWLSKRAYGRGIHLSYETIRVNHAGQHEQEMLAAEAAAIGQMPFIIDQRRGQTLAQIGVRARRVQAQMARRGQKLGLVVIDHLQRIAADGRYRGNKTAEVTDVARGLKDLAGALDVAILCLSQLNRGVEGRDDKRPQLSDLRESGAIEEEADAVLLLYRPEYYASKNPPDEATDFEAYAQWQSNLARSRGLLQINAAKVRHGQTVDLTVRCNIGCNWIGGEA
jgi:replicative DNA helicase